MDLERRKELARLLEQQFADAEEVEEEEEDPFEAHLRDHGIEE